jgi:hypothetical protein
MIEALFPLLVITIGLGIGCGSEDRMPVKEGAEAVSV